MNKSLVIRSIIIGFVSGIVLYGVLTPQIINADSESPILVLNPAKVAENSQVKFCSLPASSYKVVKTIKMVITGYSSTPEQTDDTPFITASNKRVADGIIANNMLPFGTEVKIPELYGDKVFTVEDRMHKRMGIYHVDIWFPEYQQAKNFGAKVTEVEVLES